ncbi:MAG TPA: class II aldolase/adducin family protein [Labilithrix sp.]|nr:class II aldolase/adducin family protein [Labilithrix sp.]
MENAEREARIDLAACYRIVAHHGWDDSVFTHISARVPGTDHFLINRFGLLFEEITASSLVKVDQSGKTIDDPTAEINPAGFIIHGAVHTFRPEAACVIHLHTVAGVAVSAQAEGLLPISQDALRFDGQVAYHEYQGFVFEESERERLRLALGTCDVMILRNHGTLTVGTTVGEAFLRMYWLERACAFQIAAQGSSQPLIVPPAPIRDRARDKAAFITKRASPFAWAATLRKLDRLDPSYRE